MKAIVCQCPLDKQILMLVQRKLCQKPITSSTVDPKLLQSTIVNAVLAYNGKSWNYIDGSIDLTS